MLPEGGTLEQKHVGATSLIFIYIFNNVHLFGTIN